MTSDWRSYDPIAERYDALWAPRFEAAADELLSQVLPPEPRRALDIGTGTGAVPRVLAQRSAGRARVVGCDLSLPMLARARGTVDGIEVVAANAGKLPFRGESFDLATANFVLSHVADYRAALGEAFRILTRASAFAASNWRPATDAYSVAWRELLGAVVGRELADQATQEVAPWESYFGEAENFRATLVEAGFRRVRVESLQISFPSSAEAYLADRELSSAGRCARQVLGEPRWREFRESAREDLRRRFGAEMVLSRGFLVASGIKQ